MARILISHHDPLIVNTLRTTLEREGHWVLGLLSYRDVPNRILSHRPDLLLIEYDPDQQNDASALSSLRKVSLGSSLPLVILVSDQNREQAEPLIPKGWVDGILQENSDVSQASMMIQNLLSRPPGKKGVKRFFRYGHLELDRDTRAVRLGSAIATDVPKKLFELLWLLTKKSVESKETLTRTVIITKLWKTRVRDREVDVTISRLKSVVPFLASLIETIPGKGYRLSLPSLNATPLSSPIDNHIEKSN